MSSNRTYEDSRRGGRDSRSRRDIEIEDISEDESPAPPRRTRAAPARTGARHASTDHSSRNEPEASDESDSDQLLDTLLEESRKLDDTFIEAFEAIRHECVIQRRYSIPNGRRDDRRQSVLFNRMQDLRQRVPHLNSFFKEMEEAHEARQSPIRSRSTTSSRGSSQERNSRSHETRRRSPARYRPATTGRSRHERRTSSPSASAPRRVMPIRTAASSRRHFRITPRSPVSD